MPSDRISPGVSEKRWDTAGSCVQKTQSRFHRMVALVSTAIGCASVGRTVSLVVRTFPSQVPCPPWTCNKMVHTSHPSLRHHPSMAFPYRDLSTVRAWSDKTEDGNGSSRKTIRAHCRRSGMMSNLPFLPDPISLTSRLRLSNHSGRRIHTTDSRAKGKSHRGYRATVRVAYILGV